MNRKQISNRNRRIRVQRNRRLIIGGVIGVAILVVAILILQHPRTVGAFSTVTKQNWPQANGKSLGPAEAKVVVMEFADFQCPYCREFHDNIFPTLVSQYISTGKIRFEYHHFIVIDNNVGGRESRSAAEASECASEQGDFWDYFNMLFTNQQSEGSGTFSDDRLKAFASALGLDTAKFNSCFNSGKYSQQVMADENMAATFKLTGTPSILVNNNLVQNPLDYTQVQTAIENALKSQGQ